MTNSRQNSAEEQQQASHQARSIATLCEQWCLSLDHIDWQQWGMQALVKVNGVEIASLLYLSQREQDDLLRLIQLKLLEHAALEASPGRSKVKAVMWRPITVVQPQVFLSLWVITLETDERIPIIESMSNGQRNYEPYLFDAENGQQLSTLFGAVFHGAYDLGEVVTIKEHTRLYTGVIIYSISSNKEYPNRKVLPRGPLAAETAAPTYKAATYIVHCHDGFPHIVEQSQIIRGT